MGDRGEAGGWQEGTEWEEIGRDGKGGEGTGCDGYRVERLLHLLKTLDPSLRN